MAGYRRQTLYGFRLPVDVDETTAREVERLADEIEVPKAAIARRLIAAGMPSVRREVRREARALAASRAPVGLVMPAGSA